MANNNIKITKHGTNWYNSGKTIVCPECNSCNVKTVIVSTLSILRCECMSCFCEFDIQRKE